MELGDGWQASWRAGVELWKARLPTGERPINEGVI